MGRDNRQEFPPAIKRALERRVNSRCSHPNCRVPTSGPHTDPMKAGSIGEAAHIAAAAPGGPRYDQAMTPGERRGAGNGIWLCSNHADEIDKDELRFPATLLHEWKRQAERLAAAERGKPIPSQRELDVFKSKALGEKVSAASVGELISEVHAIGAREIRRLDPRFAATITVRDGATTFALNPLEPVKLTLTAVGAAAQALSNKLSNLEKHGHRLEMDMEGIQIEGSPLIEELFGKPGKITLDPHRQRKARQRIAWTDVRSGKPMLAEFVGKIFGGVESVSFEGDLFDGLHTMNYQFPLSASGRTTVGIGGGWVFSRWDGRSVCTLPYFDKCYSLYRAIASGQKISSWLDVDGQDILTCTAFELAPLDDAVDIVRFLTHLEKARDLLQALRTDVTFHSTTITADELQMVADSWLWLCHLQSLRGTEIGVVNATIVPVTDAEAESLNQNVRERALFVVRVDHEPLRPLQILGHEVPIGKFTTILSNIRMVPKGPWSQFFPRKPAQVEFVATDACRVETIISS